MTVHEMLRRTVATGIKTLQFSWGDSYVDVSLARLEGAVKVGVGENVDEHTRLDWMTVSKEWLKRMRDGDEEEQIIAHVVWCLIISREWEDYATKAIHTAVAEALLRKEKSK